MTHQFLFPLPQPPAPSNVHGFDDSRFLTRAHKQNRRVFVYLGLADITGHRVFKVRPCGGRCRNVFPFYEWLGFHCVDGGHLVRPFIRRWTLGLVLTLAYGRRHCCGRGMCMQWCIYSRGITPIPSVQLLVETKEVWSQRAAVLGARDRRRPVPRPGTLSGGHRPDADRFFYCSPFSQEKRKIFPLPASLSNVEERKQAEGLPVSGRGEGSCVWNTHTGWVPSTGRLPRGGPTVHCSGPRAGPSGAAGWM